MRPYKLMDPAICVEFLNTSHGLRILEWFNKHKSGVEDPAGLITSICKNKSNDLPKNYLDVGGGIGEKTIAIAKNLQCQHIDFLEPSAKATGFFVESARGEKISFSTHQKTFEGFVPDYDFDLITAIHSWYYVDVHFLGRLCSMLKKGGHAYIWMDSVQDTIKRIQNICEAHLYSSRSNNAEDIEEYLTMHHFPYRVVRDDDVTWGLLYRGQFTVRAKDIISLVSWTKWEDIPEYTKNAICDLLLDISPSDDQYRTCRRLFIVEKK